MRLPEKNNDTLRQSAGEEFVKKIGLLGAILFLILSILGTILMFISGSMEREESGDPSPASYYASICTFPHQRV